MSKKWLIGLGVFFAVLLLLGMGGCSLVVGVRNNVVTADETIESSWAQVENVLQRRADLIPNLVETVKGIAKQEREVFIKVTEARAKATGAQTRPEKIAANQELSGALSRLLVVLENYPQLKSNENFLTLQTQLEGTENRITVERQRYNDAVRSYNVLVRRFPANIIAKMFGYTKKDEYFEAAPEAKTVPPVKFD